MKEIERVLRAGGDEQNQGNLAVEGIQRATQVSFNTHQALGSISASNLTFRAT